MSSPTSTSTSTPPTTPTSGEERQKEAQSRRKMKKKSPPSSHLVGLDKIIQDGSRSSGSSPRTPQEVRPRSHSKDFDWLMQPDGDESNTNSRGGQSPLLHPQVEKLQFSEPFEGGQRSHDPKARNKFHRSRSPGVPSLDLTSTRHSRNDGVQDEETRVETSPRDDMKVIEARVRLAKWASSGEMPWKMAAEKKEGSGNRLKVSKLRDGEDEEEEKYRRVKDLLKKEATRPDAEFSDLDLDGFRRPGVKAVEFVKQQKERSTSRRNMEGRKEEEDGVRSAMLRESWEGSTSGGSESSFVTLEPDVTDKQADSRTNTRTDRQGERLANGKLNRHSDTRTDKQVHGHSDRQADTQADRPFPKTGLTSSSNALFAEARQDMGVYQEDYERIRAAVLGSGGNCVGGLVSGGGCVGGLVSGGGPTGGYGKGIVEAMTTSSSDDSEALPRYGYSRDRSPHMARLPTSTPARRSHDATGNSLNAKADQSQHWKPVGGSQFFLSRDSPKERGVSLPSDMQARQSHTLPRFSARSREKRGPEDLGDLVQRSAEFTFPSDLSGITHSSEGPGIWRYKSLEDLIPSKRREAGEREEMRDVRLMGGGRKKMERVRGDELLDGEREGGDKQRGERRQATPVQAMDSVFWEREMREEDEEEEEQVQWPYDLSRGRPQALADPLSHWAGQERGRRANVADLASHSTAKCDSTREHYGQSIERDITDPQRDYRTVHHRENHTGHHRENHTGHHRSGGLSKMTRSTSEQSLHTLHMDRNGTTVAPAKLPPAPHDDIDLLVNAYAATTPFDLRPFSLEEQF